MPAPAGNCTARARLSCLALMRGASARAPSTEQTERKDGSGDVILGLAFIVWQLYSIMSRETVTHSPKQ